MNELQADIKFEQHYAEVLAFVQKQKHASCFEIMKQFHVGYADSVHLIDTLEERGIVDASDPEVRGPRPLLNGASPRKKVKRAELPEPPEPEPRRWNKRSALSADPVEKQSIAMFEDIVESDDEKLVEAKVNDGSPQKPVSKVRKRTRVGRG